MAVAWVPTLAQVAKYVPRRTITGAADGYGNALATFDQTTHPTDTQVGALIADAVAWVQLKVGTADADVDATLTTQAAAVAALRAAAMVELGYPDNRDDLTNGQTLLAEANAMRDDLWRANEAATGQDVEDPAAHLFPVFAFPDPFAAGDLEFN